MIDPLFLILYLLLLFFGFFEIFAKNKKYNIIFYSLSTVLFVIAGIRYQTGADYGSYRDIFYSVKDAKGYFSNFKIERGFFILNYFFKDFEYGFEIVLFIMAYLGLFITALFSWGICSDSSIRCRLIYHDCLTLCDREKIC